MQNIAEGSQASGTSKKTELKLTNVARASLEELAANAAHTLIGVTCRLLDRQIKAQSNAFLKEGGFTERLYRLRKKSSSLLNVYVHLVYKVHIVHSVQEIRIADRRTRPLLLSARKVFQGQRGF